MRILFNFKIWQRPALDIIIKLCNEDERLKKSVTCILCQYADILQAYLCLTDPSNFPQLYDN